MINIGIIGIGDFGIEHVRTIQSLKGVELFGICDRNIERLRKVKEEFCIPDEKTYTSSTELLQSEKLDAVVIATDEVSHEPLVNEAVSNGKHVLIEKPITTDVLTAERLLELSKKSNLVIIPGHMLRFDPGYATIKDGLENLNSRILSLRFKRNVPFQRFSLHSRTHPVFMALSHDIDQLIWNTKVSPKRIYAMEKKIVDDINMPGIFFGLIEMEDGSICSLETQWCLPNEYGQYLDVEFEVMYEGGHLSYRFPGDTLSMMTKGRLSRPDIQLSTAIHGEFYGALRNELEHFISLIQNPQLKPITTMEEAVLGVKICDALIKSAKEQREIIWENL